MLLKKALESPLSRVENLERIIQIQLKKVVALLADRGLNLELTRAAEDLLMAEGYDPQYGARPMRRAIQRLIQDPLAMQLLSGEFKSGDTVVADADPRTRTLRFEKHEQNRDREGAEKEAVTT